MRVWNSLVEPDPLQGHGTLGIAGTSTRSISMKSSSPLMTGNGWNDGDHIYIHNHERYLKPQSNMDYKQ